MTLQDYLKAEGYDTSVRTDWDKNVHVWRSWYDGKVDKFHKYFIYNGRRRVPQERLSMQMAKKSCEDWADQLFNERVEIAVNDNASQKQLDELLSRTDFRLLVNEGVEQSGAVGTVGFVVSVCDLQYDTVQGTIDVSRAEPRLELVDYDSIYPLSWTGRVVTECAFSASRTIRGKKYVFLSMHKKNAAGNYVIRNVAFSDNNGSLTEINMNGLSREFDTKSPSPWFALLTPAGASNSMRGLPWGLPYFAQAIDIMKALDTAYDSLNTEILLGRRRIFARADLLQESITGEKVFDDSDIAIYALPHGLNQDDLLQTEAHELRCEALIKSIEFDLNLFSTQVGFGKSHYRFTDPTQQTATAVVSADSAMQRRRVKHQTPLLKAVDTLVRALAYAATAFGRYSINLDGLTITMPDDVVEDTEAKAQRALREVSAKIRSRAEYREDIFGDSPEAAKEAITAIDEMEPSIERLIGG